MKKQLKLAYAGVSNKRNQQQNIKMMEYIATKNQLSTLLGNSKNRKSEDEKKKKEGSYSLQCPLDRIGVTQQNIDNTF